MRTLGRAISPSELLPHLESLFRRAQVPRPDHDLSQTHTIQRPQHVKIGLCVSGGPDSMALAYLLRGNTSTIKSVQLDPLAFIVDHRARQGSTEEALKVQGFLQKIGVPARILTMKWPGDVSPLALSNFESRARYLRYRLIARSAIREGIDHLFVGHHQDDQVETVLMRLIRQVEPGLIGLRGISSESPIPCCDDIYGAHEQGTELPGKSSLQPVGEDSSLGPSSICSFPVAPSAPGGILLHRPLLAFPKPDLIATCQQHDVPFVIDLTNKDPRSNTRNAVRYMRSNYSLPRALSSRAILDLQSHAQHKQHETELNGVEELRKFLIKRLDLRTGTTEVTIPALLDNETTTLKAKADAILNLVESVTPNPRSDRALQLPQHVFDAIYSDSGPTASSVFTFRRVTFIPHPTELRTWTLARQPMRRSECVLNRWSFAARTDEDQGTDKTEWRLWDNRFWIRLSAHNAMLNEVEMAPFALFADRLSARAREDLEPFKKLLAKIAPGKNKLNLPVIVYQGHMIGLPTLGVRFTQTMLSLRVQIDWEVRYKAMKCIEHLRVLHAN